MSPIQREREILQCWRAQLAHRFVKEDFAYVDLDQAATTKPFISVQKRIDEVVRHYGSVHRGTGMHSQQTTDEYERAKQTIREFIGATQEEYVIVTKNTTEAINHAAAIWKSIPGQVLVSDIEHSSNLLPWMQTGDPVRFSTTPEGKIECEVIEKELAARKNLTKEERIKLVAITGASNITGHRPAIHDIAKIAHRYGANILVDVCQLLPHKKISMKPQEDPEHLDFLTFSGHKMYAPYGAGILVGPKLFFDAVPLYQVGGGNTPYITHDGRAVRFAAERDHDPGSPNVLGVIAIESAIKELEDIGQERVSWYEQNLADYAAESLKDMGGVTVHPREEGSTVIPFDIEGMRSKQVAHLLADKGIGVRAGGFCVYEFIRKLK